MVKMCLHVMVLNGRALAKMCLLLEVHCGELCLHLSQSGSTWLSNDKNMSTLARSVSTQLSNGKNMSTFGTKRWYTAG